MDVHYISPSEEDLYRAMAKYTEWLDSQILVVSQSFMHQPHSSAPPH